MRQLLALLLFTASVASKRNHVHSHVRSHNRNHQGDEVYSWPSLHPSRTPAWLARDDPNHGPQYPQPEQIHLSYAGDPTRMWVTWLTFDDTLTATVEYGERRLEKSAEGKISIFVDGQKDSKWRYICRVLLKGLEPGKTYRYHVGSVYGWSAIYEFTAVKPRPEGGLNLAIFGDMGNENARSLGRIQRLAQQGKIDGVLHVGDLAYNMDENGGAMGDEFMRQIEPVAAYIPYMTSVGNHEAFNNFTHYVNRFTMPGGEKNLFYSYDLDQVHFISFSTEFYFFTQYGWEQIGRQWNWLINDLKKANANRHNVPWIVTLGHRPMYCSDFDGDDCTKYESVIRTGLPKTHAYGLEKLFYEYGVDLEFWAHEHTYERFYPVFNRTVFKGSQGAYIDPPAPVHIVSGSAGCRENTDTFIEHPGPWSAFRSSNYGFGIIRAYNATHLHFQQVAASSEDVEDEMWLVRHRHGYSSADLRRLARQGDYVQMDHCHHPTHCPHSLEFYDNMEL